MFKQSERMSKREFDAFWKIGTRAHFPHLTLITAPAESRKVSAVVGKKVARLAVRRNTLRRRLYAVMREVLDESQYSDALIVIAKPPLNTLTRTAAADTVRTAIEQVLKTP